MTQHHGTTGLADVISFFSLDLAWCRAMLFTSLSVVGGSGLSVKIRSCVL